MKHHATAFCDLYFRSETKRKMSEFLRWVLLSVVAALLAVPVRSATGQLPAAAEALRPLESVRVGLLASDRLIAAGLDTAALRTSIEVELRRDGVPLADKPSAFLCSHGQWHGDPQSRT